MVSMFLSVAIASNGAIAQGASAPTCEMLFRSIPTRSSAWEEALRDLPGDENGIRTLMLVDEVLRPTLRERFVKHVAPSVFREMRSAGTTNGEHLGLVFDSFRPSSPIDRIRLGQTVSETVEHLYGSTHSWRNYLLVDKEERNRNRALNLTREMILRRGINGLLAQEPERIDLSLREKAIIQIEKVRSSQFFNWARVPLSLPKFNAPGVSEDLLWATVKDGYHSHEAEWQTALAARNSADAYETFRRVYEPVALVLFIVVFYFHMRGNADHQVSESMAAVMDAQLDEIDELSDDVISLGKDGIEKERIATLNRYRQAYKKRYGRAPSLKEHRYARARIWAEVGAAEEER